MARNGIALSINPALGRPHAGVIWIPVPDAGVPQWMLDLPGPSKGAMSPIAAALCEEGVTHPSHRCLVVSDATWDAVVAIATELQTVARQQAELTAQANAESDALIAEYDAAISNPEPSRLLTRKERDWGVEWDWQYAGASGADSVHVKALDLARERAKIEAHRRTDASFAEFGSRVASLSDDEFFAFVGWDLSSKIGARDRWNRIEEERKRSKFDAELAEIRAAIANAPAHVLERFDAGALPEEDLKKALADALFSAIELPRYEALTESDVDHEDDCNDTDAVKFKSGNASGEMDAEEWESWKTVLAACRAAGYEPKLRMHQGYCESCNARSYRLSARVIATVGGVEAIRSYAVG